MVELPTWTLNAWLLGSTFGLVFGAGYVIGYWRGLNWAEKKLDEVTFKTTKQVDKVINGRTARMG